MINTFHEIRPGSNSVKSHIDNIKKSIKIASEQDYTSHSRGKYAALTMNFYPTNIAMNMSGVEQSRYDRTYLKINEMFKDMNISKQKTFIDIGADPGSFSQYMLFRNMKGIGVSIENKLLEDKIRGGIMKKYYDNKSYKMIRNDFFKVDFEEYGKQDVDVITCDIGRGGNNNNKWDSYDKGLGYKLDKLLKSKSYDKMSDFEFHIHVLNRCLKLMKEKNSKYLIVKMFNINDSGYVWNSKSKKVDNIKVSHKDRLDEYINKHVDNDIYMYIHKPISSPSINNEYYMIFSKTKGKLDSDIVDYDVAINKLVERKIDNLETILDFFNNISMEVFLNSKQTTIREMAKGYLIEYGLQQSFDLEVNKKPARRIRF